MIKFAVEAETGTKIVHLIYFGRRVFSSEHPHEIQAAAKAYRSNPGLIPPPPLENVVRVRIHLTLHEGNLDYGREFIREHTGREIDESDVHGYRFYPRVWPSETCRKMFARKLDLEVTYYPADGLSYEVPRPMETALNLFRRGYVLGINARRPADA